MTRGLAVLLMRLLAAPLLITGCSSEAEHVCTVIGCSELTFEVGEFPEPSITPTAMGHASVAETTYPNGPDCGACRSPVSVTEI
jgi:hypothetical protein